MRPIEPIYVVAIALFIGVFASLVGYTGGLYSANPSCIITRSTQ